MCTVQRLIAENGHVAGKIENPVKRLLPQVKIILFTMHADGVNQAFKSTFFDIGVVIAKSDSILRLREHLILLLGPVDPATRTARQANNTKVN
jgi:hypothetical protein